MPPGSSGAFGPTQPTAENNEYDQDDAFGLDANDYRAAPFSFVVPVTRPRSQVRRGVPLRTVILTAGEQSLETISAIADTGPEPPGPSERASFPTHETYEHPPRRVR